MTYPIVIRDRQQSQTLRLAIEAIVDAYDMFSLQPLPSVVTIKGEQLSETDRAVKVELVLWERCCIFKGGSVTDPEALNPLIEDLALCYLRWLPGGYYCLKRLYDVNRLSNPYLFSRESLT